MNSEGIWSMNFLSMCQQFRSVDIDGSDDMIVDAILNSCVSIKAIGYWARSCERYSKSSAWIASSARAASKSGDGSSASF